MFREGEGRELVRLLREAEKEADEREKTAQQEAINCNLKIKIRNKLKVKHFQRLAKEKRALAQRFL